MKTKMKMKIRIVRTLLPLVVLPFLLASAGCDLVDPQRPSPQPDTRVFGNLLEVKEHPTQPDALLLRVRVGVPRALTRAQKDEGRPTPTVEEGTVAEVTVGPDTVVVVGGRPGGLAELNPGTEVTVLPVAGTTRMVGVSRLLVDASHVMDFETFKSWQLPSLADPVAEAPPADPSRINSPGVEHSPVALDGGRVLYFSARLRRPWSPGGRWFGALREGLPAPAEGELSRELTYRTELGESGWSAPELIRFPGLDESAGIRVTWVNEEDTMCLVTVSAGEGDPWVGRAERSDADGPWGEVVRLDSLGEGDAADAVYLAGSATKLAFASKRSGPGGGDILLLDPAQAETPMLLDPRVNTPAVEWGPRVGPDNALLFSRGDQQLIFSGGTVEPLRLPGRFRTLMSEANPTRDGAWVFVCIPKLTPVELDQDIHVARWNEDGTLGEPVPVDDWRP